jgi:hypothetical protein
MAETGGAGRRTRISTAIPPQIARKIILMRATLALVFPARTLGQDAQRPRGMSMGADSKQIFLKHRIRPIGMAALACLLAGCVLFVPAIDEIRLVDVQSVEAGALDLHDGREDQWPKRPAKGVIGKIIVVTKSDLHDMAERYELNIWRELTICDSGATVDSRVSVYYEGVRVEYGRKDAEIQKLYRARAAAHAGNDPYTYEIYFQPRSNFKVTKGPGHPWHYDPYDFIREPRDLCLRIGGGNMLGGNFVSNTVVIPSSDLKRAFQNAHD